MTATMFSAARSLTPGIVSSCWICASKRGQPLGHLRLQGSHLLIEVADVVQLQPEQHALVLVEPPAQGFGQLLRGGPDAAIRQRRQLFGRAGPGGNGSQDGAAGLAQDVPHDRAQLELPPSSTF